MSKMRTVHRIACPAPPDECRTVTQWLQWREAANQRILAELKDYLYAVHEAQMRKALGERQH